MYPGLSGDYISRTYNGGSALLVIAEIVRDEPKLKYAFSITYHAFSSLLKINQTKAYEYGREILTATKDPSYSFIYIGVRLSHLVMIARNTVKDISAASPLSTKRGIRSIRERLDARQLAYTMHSDVRRDRFSFVLVIDFE